MIPPTSIDGTDITGATIDGTDVQEITVDGDVVFSAAATLPTAGLLHRYDASELTGETDGQNVDTFPDLAGGNDLSRTGTVLYESNGINGLPALETFDNGDGIMTGGSELSQPFAFWIAADVTGNSGSSQLIANSAGFDVKFTPVEGSGNSLRAGNEIFTGNITTGQNVLGYEADGSNSKIIEGLGIEASGNAGTNGTPGGFVIYNRRISAGNDRGLGGYWGEHLIYNMSDPGYDRVAIAEYLGQKWGISI